VHNTLHVMLTGETESYYDAYSQAPARKLARALSEGFVYQGEPSPIHDNAPRGEPSGELPPSAFVFFLQNHDQIGNRAMGERLTLLADHDALRAATMLMLLSPQIPMLFMDEENGSTRPFLFFTDYEGDLADAVREGRRKEFAKFSAFSDPARRAQIPDPNDVATFERSSLDAVRTDVGHDEPREQRVDDRSQDRTDATQMSAREWRHFYQSALAVRHKLLIPRLERTRALGAQILAEPPTPDGETAALMAARRPAAPNAHTYTGTREYGARGSQGKGGGVRAQWRLGDGEVLTIAINLGDVELSLGDTPPGKIIFETPDRVRDHLDANRLPPRSGLAWLTGDLHGFVRAHPEARA
jgi:maltooligosyltrehalose trehalohydrolase